MLQLTRRTALTALLLAAALVTAVLPAQTKVKLPKNKFPVSEDVKLGREAAAEVRKTTPLLQDRTVGEYISGLGDRLVAAVPPRYRIPEFTYSFEVVNQAEINAFALPGGPMFVNRGMIEKAGSEGGVVGVMAHEISHVLLRHGTAQLTKAQRFQLGAIAGQILGAVVGGATGSIIAQGSEFGLGAYFLKFSREYEKQADLLGSQILARAGWEPREMAEVFKAIEKEGGSGGPQWLSSHPNPGNRYEYILKEARSLTVAPGGGTGRFDAIRTRLGGLPPAYTAQQVAEMQKKGVPQNAPPPAPTGVRAVKVAGPATDTRAYAVDGVELTVPSNWTRQRQLTDPTFTPEGAVATVGTGVAFTHGIQFGFTAAVTPRLDQETGALINNLRLANPDIKSAGDATPTTAGGRAALSTPLTNRSEVTGAQESLTLVTAMTSDGRLFYLVGVAPSAEIAAYTKPFDQVRQSLKLP